MSEEGPTLIAIDKCRICAVELDKANCSYEDDICDDCFETECDEQLSESED